MRVWLFAYFVVITIGELYLSPISLSLVSKIAPARMISTNDGPVAWHQLHGQFRRRLARQLLGPNGAQICQTCQIEPSLTLQYSVIWRMSVEHRRRIRNFERTN
jgi:hypothetical protein